MCLHEYWVRATMLFEFGKNVIDMSVMAADPCEAEARAMIRATCLAACMNTPLSGVRVSFILGPGVTAQTI